MSEVITLTRIGIDEFDVPIVGLTPLVTHAWSEKARRQMAEGSSKSAAGNRAPKVKKAPRDPQGEYEAAFYRLPDGSAGIPAAAFKSATVQGARSFDALTMTAIKQAIFVVGEGPDQLVKIIGEPELWESPVRLASGVADLRYRPRFWPWSAILTVRFNPVLLNKESVLALIDAGGMAGVGEWRPSAPKSYTGTFGMFKVDA